MITTEGLQKTSNVQTYYGLSTDPKPVEGVSNGSAFVEMDTGKVYFYNEAGTEWLEWGA